MDSDSTFHPASQLNLAFASPMTPMCVKMAALPVHLSPRTSISTLDKLRIIALIHQIKNTFRDHSSCLPTPPHGVATVETGRVAHFGPTRAGAPQAHDSHGLPAEATRPTSQQYAPGLSKAVTLHGQRPTRPSRLNTVSDEATVSFDTPRLPAGDTTPPQYAPPALACRRLVSCRANSEDTQRPCARRTRRNQSAHRRRHTRQRCPILATSAIAPSSLSRDVVPGPKRAAPPLRSPSLLAPHATMSAPPVLPSSPPPQSPPLPPLPSSRLLPSSGRWLQARRALRWRRLMDVWTAWMRSALMPD